MEHRRNIAPLQEYGAVRTPLDYLRDADARIHVGGVPLAQQLEPQRPDLHERAAPGLERRVGRLDLLRDVTCQALVRVAIVFLERTRPAHRQREHDEFVLEVGGNLERRWGWIRPRNVERRAVGQHALCREDLELADREHCRVELQRSETPSSAARGRRRPSSMAST